jgi:hypothetical protein
MCHIGRKISFRASLAHGVTATRSLSFSDERLSLTILTPFYCKSRAGRVRRGANHVASLDWSSMFPGRSLSIYLGKDRETNLSRLQTGWGVQATHKCAIARTLLTEVVNAKLSTFARIGNLIIMKRMFAKSVSSLLCTLLSPSRRSYFVFCVELRAVP